jgi:excisionase family DNA binding protein
MALQTPQNDEQTHSVGLLDVAEAAQLLGIGRTLAYELIRAGDWPTPVVRINRLIKIPRKPLLDFITTGHAEDSRA